MQIKEWLNNKNSKIIVTSRIDNANRLIRKFNIEENKVLKQVYTMTIQQIAHELLVAYRASRYNKNEEVIVLKPWEETMLLHEMLQKKTYEFLPENSKTLRTAETILNTLNQIRANSKKEEYKQSKDKKLQELDSIIKEYETKLREYNLEDRISLLESAYQVLDELEHQKTYMLQFLLPWNQGKVKFGVLEGEVENWTEIEKKFWNKLLQISQKETEILEFRKKGSEPTVIYKAYGQVNEIGYIIDCMNTKSCPCGDVNIFYTTPEYENLISGSLGAAGIPHRFVNGRHITSTDFVQFMLDCIRWAKDDFSYKTLQNVMKNPKVFYKTKDKEQSVKYVSLLKTFYNHISDGIGWGRDRYISYVEQEELKNDKTEQETLWIEFIKNLVNVFEPEITCGTVYSRLLKFAKDYTFKNNMERKNVVPVLETQERMFKHVASEKRLKSPSENSEILDLIEQCLKDLVINENSETDAVNIYRLSEAEILERQYNFFIGMSEEQFVLDTTESPVLSDQELTMYLEGTLKLAKDKNKKRYHDLKATIESLQSGEVYMGYSIFDTIQLRKTSPSYFILEYKKEENKEPFTYLVFDADVSWESAFNGEEEKESPEVEHNESVDEEKSQTTEDIIEDSLEEIMLDEKTTEIPEIRMSSSGLQSLLKCPLKYYYHYLKHIPDVQYSEKKGDRWLNPATNGNLFHRTMEIYCNQMIQKYGGLLSEDMDQDRFEKAYNLAVEAILKECPYSSKERFLFEKQEKHQDILEYVEEFHKQWDSKWNILGCEYKFENVKYETGQIVINFNGSIDRLDGYVDEGGCLRLGIIDYKTGKYGTKKEEIEEGVQIQHYIYGLAAVQFVMEKKEELECLLKKNICAVCIEKADYIFPYETEKRLSVVEELNRATTREVQEPLNIHINMPDQVNQKIDEIIGNFLNHDFAKTQEALDCMLKEMLEKSKEKKTEPCKYCSYTDVCRKEFYPTEIKDTVEEKSGEA